MNASADMSVGRNSGGKPSLKRKSPGRLVITVRDGDTEYRLVSRKWDSETMSDVDVAESTRDTTKDMENPHQAKRPKLEATEARLGAANDTEDPELPTLEAAESPELPEALENRTKQQASKRRGNPRLWMLWKPPTPSPPLLADYLPPARWAAFMLPEPTTGAVSRATLRPYIQSPLRRCANASDD